MDYFGYTLLAEVGARGGARLHVPAHEILKLK